MSAGSFLLVRFGDRELLPSAIATLNQLGQIQNWDAVDGYYSLVIRTASDVNGVVSAIEALDGFEELARCDLQSGTDTTLSIPDDQTASYLFLETEQEKRDAIVTELGKIDQIALCAPTEGGFDLVALATGENFDAVDRVIAEKVRSLDGVLRLKQDRIIHLDRI